jgi:DNA-directed RNA polymerase specialized sigma24 family protein
MADSLNTRQNPFKNSGFVTTHWSVVMAAGQGDSTLAADALEQLCQTYWYPLYAYVRRQGHKPQDAEDLTQEFFTHTSGGRTRHWADFAASCWPV